MKRILTAAGVLILAVTAAFAGLMYLGIIWRSPQFYSVKQEKQFAVPIMDMAAYDTLGNHRRPYLYEIKKGKGAVYVLGIEHTKDPNDAQIALLNATWQSFNPDVAMVEGRLGFLFSGMQDPVAQYGEGGAAVALAKKDGVPFYTWEPKKEDEVKIVLSEFNPKQAAAFYALRPYLSNLRFGKPADPDAKLQEYIDSRTDVDGLRGAITSVAQIDSLWKKDYPKAKDWRDSSDEYGWPEGYLGAIFSKSNQLRDIHLCSAVSELVRDGRKVLVTMGSSHAFRIESTLREELK